MASLKDIAAACGVSVATVSKSLSDHSDISRSTKERVRAKAREMGYLPNLSARYLKTNRSFNIGVLFDEAAGSGLTHDFFASVLQGFKNEAEQNGYDVTFLNASTPGMSYVERARYRGLDGAVIVCTDFHGQNVQELLSSDLKVVTIDYSSEGRPAILSDNEDGIRQLMRYVIDQGHRRIAYIYGEDSSATSIRLDTFKSILRDAGISIPPTYIKEGKYRDIVLAYQLTLQLLDLEEPPTCIFYPDDVASFGGINAIRSRGLTVPSDVSVVGYDGIRMAQYLEPRLTTLAQDTAGLGKKAAKCLITEIEYSSESSPRVTQIRGRLVEGQTVARL